jgi:outer membrane receptor protein involved in Fe transport
MVLAPAVFATLSLALIATDIPLTGRVIDANSGTPVVGAELTIVGERGSVRTDAAGRFTWPSVPPLPLVVVIVLADGRVAKPVQLTALETGRDVTVVVDATVSESIAVLGVAPRIDRAPAASATLLTDTDLALRNPSTLTEALDVVPGLSAIAEGQSAVPAIRGLARGRTLVLVDGARATSERRAGTNASFLDPGIVRSIEVARGPGSVAYGSDAFGGVIAARTRAPDFHRGMRVRFAGTAGGGVPERRGEMEVVNGHGSGGVLVAVRAREFDDYDSPRGEVTNSGWRDRGIRGRWDQRTEASLWSIGWQSDFGRGLGRPRSDSDVILATSPLDDSHRLTISYERYSVAGFRHVRLDALAGAARQRIEQDRLATTGRPRNVERSDVSSREMQVRLTGERVIDRTRLHMGVDVQGRYGLEASDTTLLYNQAGALTTTSTSISIESAHRTAVGLFGEGETQLARRLRLSGGLRIDAVHNRNTGGYFGDRSVPNVAVAGLAAATLAPMQGLTVTGQVARGFRDPILSDRFYRGPVGRGFIEGNPTLTPETSLQFDLTSQYRAGPIRFAAAVYKYRITDLIERYAATPTLFLFRNRSQAELQGIELEVQTTLSRGFALTATAEASRGRDAADHTPLDDVAPAAASVALRHSIGARIGWYSRVKAVASHDETGPSEVPTRQHTLVDAGVSWRMTQKLELRGMVRNLSNQAYESSAGPRWVWAPGRHASATIVASF